jgi:hypothetical protein
LALDGAAAYALSFSASGVGKAYLAMAFSANQWTPGAISGDFVIRTASSQNILFSTTAGSTTAAIINSSGNVGIGTTSPQCILETTGLIRIDGLGAVPTTGAGVEIYYSGGGVLQAYNRTGGAVSQMSIYGSPLQLNSVAGTIVGIANPPTMQDALEVNGNVRVQNYNATENSGKGMSIGFNPTNNNGFFIAYNYATPATLPIRIDANPLIINGSSGLFVGINQNSPSQPLMVATAYCTGTTWTNSSDAALKHNFTDVDGDLLLSRLGSLPVREWSYISEGEVRRMGPTAQDFLAAFHLGDDPLAISTVDGIGVALLACKRLLERLELLERKLVQ